MFYFCEHPCYNMNNGGIYMLNNKELGLYLKGIREKHELSLRQVGTQASMSYSHLSMIENGTRKPTALTLKELAKVYNVDYIELYKKAGYIDLAESEQLSNVNDNDDEYVIDTRGLTEEEIESIKRYIEFIKNEKKNDKKGDKHGI